MNWEPIEPMYSTDWLEDAPIYRAGHDVDSWILLGQTRLRHWRITGSIQCSIGPTTLTLTEAMTRAEKVFKAWLEATGRK